MSQKKDAKLLKILDFLQNFIKNLSFLTPDPLSRNVNAELHLKEQRVKRLEQERAKKRKTE